VSNCCFIKLSFRRAYKTTSHGPVPSKWMAPESMISIPTKVQRKTVVTIADIYLRIVHIQERQLDARCGHVGSLASWLEGASVMASLCFTCCLQPYHDIVVRSSDEEVAIGKLSFSSCFLSQIAFRMQVMLGMARLRFEESPICPRALVDLLTRCLSISPDARPSTEEILVSLKIIEASLEESSSDDNAALSKPNS